MCFVQDIPAVFFMTIKNIMENSNLLLEDIPKLDLHGHRYGVGRSSSSNQSSQPTV